MNNEYNGDKQKLVVATINIDGHTVKDRQMEITYPH